MTLGQVMGLVAGLSLLFAMLGVVGGAIAASTLLVLAWPVLVDSPPRRVEAWAWSAAFFPALILVSLASTWLTARLVLGHDPTQLEFRRPYPTPLIVGATIASDFLLFLLPFSFVACAALTIAAAQAHNQPTGEGTAKSARPLIWPALWLGGFAILVWDPCRFAALIRG
jgi:hypothetical protein